MKILTIPVTVVAIAISIACAPAANALTEAQTQFVDDVEQHSDLAHDRLVDDADPSNTLGDAICDDLRNGRTAYTERTDVEADEEMSATQAMVPVYWAITDLCPDQMSKRPLGGRETRAGRTRLVPKGETVRHGHGADAPPARSPACADDGRSTLDNEPRHGHRQHTRQRLLPSVLTSAAQVSERAGQWSYADRRAEPALTPRPSDCVIQKRVGLVKASQWRSCPEQCGR